MDQQREHLLLILTAEAMEALKEFFERLEAKRNTTAGGNDESDEANRN